MINNKKIDNFLQVLFFKSRSAYKLGYDKHRLRVFLSLSDEDIYNIIDYLRDKNLIEKERWNQDDQIILTAYGYDACLELRKNKSFVSIKFTNCKTLLPTGRTTIDIWYEYEVTYNEAKKERNTILVSISFILAAQWGYEGSNLEKVLLQVAKEKIIEKLSEGTLNDNEEITLLTNNSPSSNPYKITELIGIEDAEYEIELHSTPISQEIKENKIAASIIETRDRINAVFYSKHKQKLLLLNNERNLLDFFKSAFTEEEFSHRIASLSEVSRNLNADVLRKITNETDTNIKSVSLLNIFLTQENRNDQTIIESLKFFGRIRQGYPIHTDNIAGIIEGLEYFKIKYPIEDYELAWISLLNNYLNLLKKLYNILADIYLSKS